MRAVARTAGLTVEVACSRPWLSRVLAEGLAGQGRQAAQGEADVLVTVEPDRAPFDVAGWEVLTRGAWRRPGEVVLRNACSSGLDLKVSARRPALNVIARWRPPPAVRAATGVLRARARLLIRAVLLQYPALWWAQRAGRVPLHASVCTIGGPGGPSVLLAGPGGLGKSTLVSAELAAGGRSTGDNLCVTDGRRVWGLLEPRRLPADGGARGPGRRMPHGRREAPWPDRADSQVPAMLVVLGRGHGATPSVAPCDSGAAALSLAAGTYMAGELRRYWAFAATLALGTGIGEAHPAIGEAAGVLSALLPARRVVLARRPGATLSDLLGSGIGLEVT